MHIEIELKLHIELNDVIKLTNHPIVIEHCVQPPQTLQLITTYFDTLNHDLRKNNLALRIREDAGKFSQIVKGKGKTLGNLHERYEWETTISSQQPVIAAIDAQIRPTIAKIIAGKRLLPVFKTVFARTRWLLNINTDQIELVFDKGYIKAGELTENISEIELELVQGDPACLEKLANLLSADIPLTAETRSKAQRGYVLCRAIIPK